MRNVRVEPYFSNFIVFLTFNMSVTSLLRFVLGSRNRNVVYTSYSIFTAVLLTGVGFELTINKAILIDI